MTMVVGMFSSLLGAQRAVTDLVDAGFRRSRISMLVRDGARHAANEDDEQGPLARATNSVARGGSVIAGGPLKEALEAETGESDDAVTHTLSIAGLQPAAARFFADAIINGAILVAVHCAEDEVRDARDILDVHVGYEEPEPRSVDSATSSRPVT